MMYINSQLFLALIGICCMASPSLQQDYHRRKIDATIIIDNSPSVPAEDLLDPSCQNLSSFQRGGPVCGNDGITYPSVAHVKCHNRKLSHKYRIHVRHRGSCTDSFQDSSPTRCVDNLLYEPVCGSDNHTYANKEALECKNKLQPGHAVSIVRNGECFVEGCPSIGDVDKVCGSNGITYRNVDEVRCLKRYNPELRILHAGGCTVREVRRNLGKRMSCHMAKNRFEWNPVCGENNITFANPYLYICHHPKNEGKCAARPGECGTLQQLACSNTIKINRNQLESSSLVCGSNKITYRSYEHLHCASIYDKHLTAISVGKCKKTHNPCASDKHLIDGGSPVCGSDKNTYVSITALWCVKYKKNSDLKYIHDGKCI